MGVLSNKTVLITGGSSGIGKSIAMRFASEGANVAVLASSSRAKADAVVDEIKAGGGSARSYVANIRDGAACRALVLDVAEQQGPIDILVTSAGVFIPNAIGSGNSTALDDMYEVNVRGTYNCIDAVVPAMKEKKEGRIICISSVAARLGISGFSAYCASKAAIAMLVQSLALELAPLNININAIAPGNTSTPMNEHVRMDPAEARHKAQLEAITPSVRTFSESADIAELALFLASPAGRAMHGSLLVIDEGVSAGITL